jgi:myo-inositol-1(or 4)-monophosphatase
MLQDIITAAHAGGKILRSYFGHTLELQRKTTAANFSTKADHDSEKAILDCLTKAFPEYGILAEESGLIDKHSDYLFVVDPLDGTNNFTLGMPYFSVSIGLYEKNTLIAGVVYNPILDQTYAAQRGRGATFNGKPMRLSTQTDIVHSTVSYCCHYHTPHAEQQRIVDAITSLGVKRILRSWSPALDLCLLASGKIEAMLVAAEELYDFAGGKIIAREAGAIECDWKGEQVKDDKETVFLLANNPMIQGAILSVL